MATHNGHVLVSTNAPDDDDPWCKNCGVYMRDEDGLRCPEAPELEGQTSLAATSTQPEWGDIYDHQLDAPTQEQPHETGHELKDW